MIGEQIQTVVLLSQQTGRPLVDSIHLEQVIMLPEPARKNGDLSMHIL
jgi:hypothetical protein